MKLESFTGVFLIFIALTVVAVIYHLLCGSEEELFAFQMEHLAPIHDGNKPWKKHSEISLGLEESPGDATNSDEDDAEDIKTV